MGEEETGRPRSVMGGARFSRRASLVRELRTGGSYLASEDPRAHFGLGESVATVAAVEVRWPDGAEERLEEVPGGGWVTVTHP